MVPSLYLKQDFKDAVWSLIHKNYSKPMNTLNRGAHERPITEQVLGFDAFSWHADLFTLKQFLNK